ncbi:hypothetical protein NCT2013_14860 [Enterobacter sp. M4-VN]|nr:hypothetical protein NCT2013_14860 [Enterobacter sp. M4-VN]
MTLAEGMKLPRIKTRLSSHGFNQISRKRGKMLINSYYMFRSFCFSDPLFMGSASFGFHYKAQRL